MRVTAAPNPRKMVFTLLGTGSSGGVPRIDGNWGICDPSQPKNRRGRCGALVQVWGEGDEGGRPTTILIDTSPDLRTQILAAEISYIDAIIYTHDHADQTHGIDDVRAIVARLGHQIPAYMDPYTKERLTKRFDYIFTQAANSSYPALLEARDLPASGQPFSIDGPGGPVEITPLRQIHGDIDSYGFRIGNLAYCNDVNHLPDDTFARLYGLDVFIIDALRPKPHPSHAHLAQALEWIERLDPTSAYLTNLHIDMDYDSLRKSLPTRVRPAYDGQQIRLSL